MGADLAAQLFGLLGHQQLQLKTVTAQLGQILIALGFQRLVFNALQAKNLYSRLHFCNFVGAVWGDAPHRFAIGKSRHRGRQRVQTAGDIAAHIYPDNRQRNQQGRHRSPDI